jgi:hypothetical protein
MLPFGINELPHFQGGRSDLSHRIGQEKNAERRQELLKAIQNGSVASWGHINLHGEYDFADEKLQDSVGLHMPPELALNVP